MIKGGLSLPLIIVLGVASFLTFDNVAENPADELDAIQGIRMINWNSGSPYIGTSVILSYYGPTPNSGYRGVQIRFYNPFVTENPTTVKYRVAWGGSGWSTWRDL